MEFPGSNQTSGTAETLKIRRRAQQTIYSGSSRLRFRMSRLHRFYHERLGRPGRESATQKELQMMMLLALNAPCKSMRRKG
nr:hypothetical protein CFP56_76058 [Quercus suber]